MTATHTSPRPSTPTTPESGTGKAKDPLFSNAKVILIVLVVCGHVWSLLMGESETIRALYVTLYAFHMPAFILLCGYFSRSFDGRRDQLYRLVTSTLVPYVIFSFLYGGLRWWTEGKPDPSLLSPYYLLWFLVALFMWRLTSQVWTMVRYPITIAVVISLGAATMELTNVLDLGRILQFLPFFVAGMLLRREHFERLRRPVPRIVASLGAGSILATALLFGTAVDRQWLYLNKGAQQLGLSSLTGLAMRAALLAAAVVLLAAFFAWVPRREWRWTKLGEATMYAYLLHGLFVKAAEDGLGLFERDYIHTTVGEIATTVAAVLLALALMSPPVRWLLRPLVEPDLSWSVKRSAFPHPAGSR